MRGIGRRTGIGSTAGWRTVGSRIRAPLVAVALVALAAATCTDPQPETTAPTEPVVPRGGVLRVAMIEDLDGTIDPQRAYSSPTFELFRCCLLRTLLSYNGKTTAEGGSILRADLAVALPEISDDGLTWTFTLQEGLRYAPPFEDVEVTSPDLVRALEREANPRVTGGGSVGYGYYYSVIEGFDDFMSGQTDSIAGLETPDPYTLVVHVSEPAGHLGHLFAMPATAPIPPDEPDEPLGASEGHADERGYGRFLVATGPYMIEGSEALDFSVPAKDQVPVSGYHPAATNAAWYITRPGSLTLVRNPSWDPASDPLRPAYVDRIDMTLGAAADPGVLPMYRQVQAGELDLVFDPHDVPLPPVVARAYEREPLAPFLHVAETDALWYLGMNVAARPFDDVHVRRAMDLVIDKGRIVRLRAEAAGSAAVATHVLADPLENGLLSGYDPYATEGSHGDLAAAQEEMRLSAYDGDGDGRCDDTRCRAVSAIVADWREFPAIARSVRSDLEGLGIELDLELVTWPKMYERCGDPARQVAACFMGWAKDFPDGASWAPPLFASNGFVNYSLLGASSEDLTAWGYEAISVPSVDAEIEACASVTGMQRFECWANFDMRVMEAVVPWVPLWLDRSTWITSTRVRNYSFSQSTASPALDQLAVETGSG